MSNNPKLHCKNRLIAIDNSTNIIWSWNSKPFGDTLAEEDVDSDNQKFVMNLRFPGQYFDSESGTHYNINRDYNPLTGRYIQSDPIGFDGGVNGFGYAEENTLINIDANRQFAQAIYLNPVAYTNPI